MRQRIGIAMALANDPDVIIADEPTTALDVTVQAQILKLLDRLAPGTGPPCIFITHDFGVVSEICDRVAVMYAGEHRRTGVDGSARTRPAHPYTRKLIACVPVLGDAANAGWHAIPGLPPRGRSPARRLRLCRALPSQAAPAGGRFALEGTSNRARGAVHPSR